MDIQFSTLKQFEVRFPNGEKGSIEDALIDQKHWRINRLIIRCGSWLFGARVGVCPSDVEIHQNGSQILQVESDRDNLPSYPNSFFESRDTPKQNHARGFKAVSDHSVKEMQGFQVQIARRWSGVIKDLVFDPVTWRIKKIVASRGVLFPRARKEISLENARKVTWFERGLLVQPSDQSGRVH